MRNPLLAAAVALALLGMTTLGPVLRPYFLQTPLADVRASVSFALYAVDLLLIVGVILAFGGRERPSLAKLAGLSAPITGPALLAVLVFAPAAAIAALNAPVSRDFDAFDIATGGVLYPLFEEIGFRGLALGALMRLCGWRFLPAALLPAAFFGAAHFWQGQGPAEIAGVVAITAFGGLVFGWLFVRWRYNLWPPFFLHAGLNTLWTVFALGETALGGWLGNALRFGVVAAALLLTLLMTKRPADATV
ncbi:MAG: CPBP family intramembrane metalloprotease [Parvularculaceae bacterium]|nr:CPBP family intramembrane metalloprotease [Parvularculaceae bacterium]